jgi:hypothetical protein
VNLETQDTAAAWRVANRFGAVGGPDTDNLIRSLAGMFGHVRAETVESAAKLCEAERCRVWTPQECAHAIRATLHPSTCAMHRWQPCDCKP